MIEPYKTKNEMLSDMRNPRYKKDEAFRAGVSERVAVTNFEDVTGASINGSIKPQSNAPVDFQDGEGVFHSKAEAMLLMKSHEYKTDAYYREMVARGLHASMPDIVQGYHHDGRVQIQGNITGPEKPRLESMFDEPSDNDGLSIGGGK